MKLTRSLSALLVGALVAAGALAAAAPAQAAAGDIHVYTDLNAMANPSDVVTMPDGTIWVAEGLDPYLHQYSAAGEHLNVFGPLPGMGGISRITPGSDGRLWLSSFQKIGVYAPGRGLDTVISLKGAYPAGGKDVTPGSLTTGSGSIWAQASSGFEGIVRMGTDGSFQDFIDLPEAVLEVDADPGNYRIWFAEYNTKYVGFVDPATDLYVRVPNPDGLLSSGRVAAMKDGTVWMSAGDSVYHVSVAGTSSTWVRQPLPTGTAVDSLDVAPDGTLWASLSDQRLFAVFPDGTTGTYGPAGSRVSDVTVIGDRLWMSGGSNYLAAMELLVPPAITACPPAKGMEGATYSSGALPTSGSAPSRFAVSSGTLPPGLSLDTTSGAVSGTPTTVGSWTFALRVTATLGTREASNDRNCTITIDEAPPTLGPLVESAPAVVGELYTATITAGGGMPKSIALVGGSMPPPGTTLSVSGRVVTITGRPTTAGTFNVQLRAENDSGNYTNAYDVVVAAAPVVAATLPAVSWPAVQVNTPFSQSVTATGDEPIMFTADPATLPPGVTITSAGRTATLSGTPTAVGDFDVEITATNPGGGDKETYRISVTPAPVAPTLGEASSSTARVGDPFESTIPITGTGMIDVQLKMGALPAGLALARTATGVRISGTPISAGPAEFTLTATNAGGTVSREYRIVVEPLAVTPGSGGVGGTTPGASSGAAAAPGSGSGGGGAAGATTGMRQGALASTGLTGLGGAPQLAVGALALALAAVGAAATAATAGRHRVFTVRSGAANRREG
ncbi:hypothetical protein DVJ78_02980 [Humibacter sp. BT305]|nr:hypothetical protein DVJ78_02980 [Humibacter sp. BT305]